MREILKLMEWLELKIEKYFMNVTRFLLAGENFDLFFWQYFLTSEGVKRATTF